MQKDKPETKKNKPFTLKLGELIVEGINISRQAKNLIYDFDSLVDVHRRYILWIDDIKESLNKKEIVKKIDISRFYEADSIPDIFPGGIEYSNIESKESQELLKNIKSETNRKLDYLREIKKTLKAKEFDKKTSKKRKRRKNNYTFSFDSIKSILFIKNKSIKIKKLSDQYFLLKTLFENKSELNEEWFFSEIAEKYDISSPPPDKKFYNAIYQLNQKIEREARIEKYFLTTNQTFQINPEYLPKSS